MTLLVHLSDLHMQDKGEPQAGLFGALVASLRHEYEALKPARVALAITGDVFDSSTQASERAVPAFLELHERLRDALGGDLPTIVLPGNHDRRRHGLFGPPRETLFRQLAFAGDREKIFVAGCSPPFLAETVPPRLHGLPAHVIAYDSTYLPSGLIGAGGTIRVEDLLMAHARLPDDDLPILVLVHHHLIPTPLTDVSQIDATGSSRVARWAVRTALPALVSHGDREELTMTAMGAGSALSLLHSFARPVLLLHGHKHVPTARFLAGMTRGCGDILIASAGSAGTRERVHATRDPDAARLWPSYNLVHWGDEGVRIESLAFSPKSSRKQPLRRQLAHATTKGPKWSPQFVTFQVEDASPRVQLDEATYTLSPSTRDDARWDFSCQRTVELSPGARLRRYIDFAHTLPLRPGPGTSGKRGNKRVVLDVPGTTRYEVPRGLARTRAEGAAHGDGGAFEWVGLLSRYGALRARLTLVPSGGRTLDAFGSITDLATGRERAARVIREGDRISIVGEKLAPRTLLRLYWPLAPS